MTSATWFLVVGVLLVLMGTSAGFIRRIPVTSAIVYLGIGLVLGPTLVGAYHFNPLRESHVLEVITEAAVVLSLFTAGLKMPVPVSPRRWRMPVLLAFAGMAVTAALMTGFGYLALGLPLGAAVLLAGILAPTDPVLATEVQVRHPGDRNRLRFGLTCEAGMNDGSALPVVMLGMGLLGLHELGGGWRWLGVDVLWVLLGGIGLGIAAGALLGWVVWRVRAGGGSDHLMDDFLGLGLIGVVYGACVHLHTGAFLAVFFAAVALRQTELRLDARAVRSGSAPREPAAPAAPHARRTTDRSLVFNEQLERFSELVLILLIGGTLFVDSWSWRAVATALFLFVVARPAGALVAGTGTRIPWRLRGLFAWFGVRGIGSLYYLMYAIENGVPEPIALELIHLTLIVVALSIVLHGVSVKPLLGRFARRSTRRAAAELP